jgi:PPOX class probable F420-dependent enzyme
MSSVLPPTTTPFGERVARRLRDEPIIWLTTVGADGTPHPNPVWFLWDGDSVLVYSLTSAVRNRNIQRDPHVALNFDGNGQGGDIIVITGEAHTSPNEPPADKNAEYVAKYKDRIARSFGTPANFGAKYGTAIRITPTKVHGI